jgi:glycosyltransferase involved in cell wall biosynthesis
MHKIKEIYTYDGVDVFPPDQSVVENLLRWSDAIITHLDYTKWTIHSAKMFKKPVFHLIHNTHTYPEIVDAEKHQHIVYNSLWAKEKLSYNWSNFILTPPVDWRHYDLEIDPEQNEYITLINLNENKGGRIFLDIARAMPNRKFLGVLGSYEQQIIPKLPNVTVVPNTTNIRQWYEKTRILLMPSEYESWGRTATEAMCSGIPVISSMAEGLVENCGTAGIFIKDRNDVKSWVEAIAKLDDKKAYAKASRKAKERSRELDPRKALDEFEQWFREMVYKYN